MPAAVSFVIDLFALISRFHSSGLFLAVCTRGIFGPVPFEPFSAGEGLGFLVVQEKQKKGAAQMALCCSFFGVVRFCLPAQMPAAAFWPARRPKVALRPAAAPDSRLG